MVTNAPWQQKSQSISTTQAILQEGQKIKSGNLGLPRPVGAARDSLLVLLVAE